MTEPTDRRARELFASARRESPPEELFERIMVAGEGARAPSHARSVAVTALFVLAAGGVLFVATRGAEQPTIGRESLPVTPPRTAAPAPVKTSAAVTPRAADTVHRVAPSASAVLEKPHSVRRSGPPALTLRDELALLETARAALASGDTARAFGALERHAAAHGTSLHAEAALLGIEARARAGRGAEAARLAREFIARYPGSPMVDRARSFAGDDADKAGDTP